MVLLVVLERYHLRMVAIFGLFNHVLLRSLVVVEVQVFEV
jgi:hypothetical protein